MHCLSVCACYHTNHLQVQASAMTCSNAARCCSYRYTSSPLSRPRPLASWPGDRGLAVASKHDAPSIPVDGQFMSLSLLGSTQHAVFVGQHAGQGACTGAVPASSEAPSSAMCCVLMGIKGSPAGIKGQALSTSAALLLGRGGLGVCCRQLHVCVWPCTHHLMDT
jgi:hypothetical protein